MVLMTKIAFLTGTRADYGLLYPLIKIILKKYFVYPIICNMHTSKNFGNTIEEVTKLNFKKRYIVRNLPKGQNSIHISDSVGLGIKQINKIFNLDKPKLVIILGDRYEALAAAISAFFYQIPILHINGGEITKGSLDDNIRNSITHLANYHCAPTKKAAKRIYQMRKAKDKIFNTGALGAYNATKIVSKNKIYFEKKYRFKFKEKNILITLHPEKSFSKDLKEIKLTLESLKYFKNVLKIFTSSNSDAMGIGINELIKDFVKNDKNSVFIKSFGREDFLSISKYLDCIFGNSSSGIIEAPILGVKTLNLGNRQLGRELSNSITNISFSKKKILGKLKMLLNRNIKKDKIKIKSPYLKKNCPFLISKVIDKIVHEKI